MLKGEEIEKLFDSVRQRDVEFVDLQIEIVDHLATEIETRRASNPSLDFELALEEVYNKFEEPKSSSVYVPKWLDFSVEHPGFSKLKIEKITYTSQYLERRMNDYFKSFFKLPRIVLTIVIYILIYMMITIGLIKVLAISVFIFFFCALFYCGIKKKSFKKQHGKFLSLSFQLGTSLAMAHMIVGYPLLHLILWMDPTTFYFPIIVSLIYVLLILSVYIPYIHFTDLLIAEIKEKYVKPNLNLT